MVLNFLNTIEEVTEEVAELTPFLRARQLIAMDGFVQLDISFPQEHDAPSLETTVCVRFVPWPKMISHVEDREEDTRPPLYLSDIKLANFTGRMPNLCVMCFEPAISCCAKCRVPYCSPACQIRDWECGVHKLVCGPKKISDEYLMLGNAIVQRIMPGVFLTAAEATSSPATFVGRSISLPVSRCAAEVAASFRRIKYVLESGEGVALQLTAICMLATARLAGSELETWNPSQDKHGWCAVTKLAGRTQIDDLVSNVDVCFKSLELRLLEIQVLEFRPLLRVGCDVWVGLTFQGWFAGPLSRCVQMFASEYAMFTLPKIPRTVWPELVDALDALTFVEITKAWHLLRSLFLDLVASATVERTLFLNVETYSGVWQYALSICDGGSTSGGVV